MSLIITGHARSGTTLLMRLCNSHPQIALTREFGNFAYVGSPFPQFRQQVLRRWYQVRNNWSLDRTRKHRRPFWFVNNSLFVLRFLWGVGRFREPLVTLKAIEASLSRIYPQIKIVGDKWPPYWLHLPKFAGLEGLKTLFIYRDCRDVTSSYLLKIRTDWRGQNWITQKGSAEKVAAGWVHMVNYMEAYTGDMKVIRYENLVTEPQECITSIGQWLNVDPSCFQTAGVKPVSIGKYKSGLSSSELEVVMHIAGPTMADLGYI